MPTALLKPCPEPACPELVEAGRCRVHARQREQVRGSREERGYDYYWRQVFKPRFNTMLISAGVLPACGAALPHVGPPVDASRCLAAGITTNITDLEYDHYPPLKPDERSQRRKVCDPTRVRILCRSCHSAETRRQILAGEV